MTATRSRTRSVHLAIVLGPVALLMATVSTTSAQVIPDLFTRVETLTLSDGTPAAGNVSIGGDTAVVYGAGGMYVFEREPRGDHWAHTATLDESGPVATDGETIVVGAAGAASVFQRVPGTHVWQEAARLTGDQSFGASVAVSATTVVVGAPFLRIPQEGPGFVYVFERDEGGPNQWGEVARLVGPPPPPPVRFNRDDFGLRVALDGDTLVVGDERFSEGEPEGAVTERALVFSRPHRDSNVWTQVATLQLTEETGGFVAGPVDISGNRILASNRYPLLSQPVGGGIGSAFLFQQGLGSDEWHQVARWGDEGAVSSGGQFLTWDGISGDLLVTTTCCQQGDVHVYARNQDGADQWGEVARGFYPLPSPPASKISAISGDTILAGGFTGLPVGFPGPHDITFKDVEVYVADTDRDGLRDGRDPCPRDPLNNVAERCLRASAVHPVLDELIAQGEVTSERQGRRQLITATFTNTSDTAVQNPFFEVTELTGRNLLLNGDAGRGRIGATLSPDVGDGVLSPGESMTVTFEIRLRTRNPFEFFVTFHGDPVPSN